MGFFTRLWESVRETITTFGRTVAGLFERETPPQAVEKIIEKTVTEPVTGWEGMAHTWHYLVEATFYNPLTGEVWTEFRTLATDEEMDWEEVMEREEEEMMETNPKMMDMLLFTMPVMTIRRPG